MDKNSPIEDRYTVLEVALHVISSVGAPHDKQLAIKALETVGSETLE